MILNYRQVYTPNKMVWDHVWGNSQKPFEMGEIRDCVYGCRACILIEIVVQ